jgi:kynurenine formamidase
VSDVADVLAGRRIVDLSLTLDERFPCTWPNNMPFEHNVENWYVPVDKEPGQQGLRSVAPFYTAWMTMHEHIGTHFDAPPHYIPPPDSGLPHASEAGARYGDRVPIEEMQGPAVVFDATHLRDAGTLGMSPVIPLEDLEAWEGEHGRLEPGDVMLLRSGWDAFYVPYPEGSRYARDVFSRTASGWPAFAPEAVELMHERGVHTMGMDTPTVGASHDPNPAHWAGLQHGMNFVESLANLGELPVRGAYFVFVPVKIAHSSGAPGRAFAYV